MILIRFALISLIIYLLLRSFIKFSEDGNASTRVDESAKKKENIPGKKVSKKIGEYVDYEEVKK
jgi:hypothetical protein